MNNEVNNQEQAQDAKRPSVSGVKRLVMFFTKLPAAPGMWMFGVLLVVGVDHVYGPSIMGAFWIVVFLFAYFFSRIASALERLADSWDWRKT